MKKQLNRILITALALILIVAAGRFLFYRHYDLYQMPDTSSMLPALNEGDLVIVELEPKSIHAGDLVAFDNGDGETFVLRMIAGPGDMIEVDEDNIHINQQPLTQAPIDQDGDRSLLRETLGGHRYIITLVTPLPGIFPAVKEKLSDDAYFVMGDNRGSARDSRLLGVIPRERIKGRVKGIITAENQWISGDDI